MLHGGDFGDLSPDSCQLIHAAGSFGSAKAAIFGGVGLPYVACLRVVRSRNVPALPFIASSTARAE